MKRGLFIMGALLSGCATTQMYEGKKLDSTQVAVIKAGPDINPIKSGVLIINKIDGKPTGIGSHKFEVLPGKHSLEVTCQLNGESVLNAHVLDVSVEAGRIYNLGLKLTLGSKKCEGYLRDG